MIRVYIIAADTADPLELALMPGRGRPRAVEILREVVTIPDLADPQRMRAIAIDFHNHYKEKGHG